MPEFLLGMKAAIYQGPKGTAIGSLTEITNARDVTVSLSAAEADATTRGNSGWRATIATLRDAEVSFEMVWKTSDASFTAIKNAFLSNVADTDLRLLEFGVLDQDRGEGTAQGILGAFSITGFERTEALEEVQMVSVTLKLAIFSSWVGA